jgi:hypothetical protein
VYRYEYLTVHVFLYLFFVQSWIVQVGLPYQLHVEVYDIHSNRVHPSDNLVIELEVEEPAYLDLTESLSNGTLHTATPRQPGQAGLGKTRFSFFKNPA